MNRLRIASPLTALAATLALAPMASAHLHINLNVDSTAEGSPLRIATYGENSFTIEDNGSGLRFLSNDSLFTLTAETLVGTQYDAVAPGLAGTRSVAAPNFTTDGGTPEAININTPAGRTAPLGYEIASVTDSDTGLDLADEYHLVWQGFSSGHGGGALALPTPADGHPTFVADSAADNVLGRSYLLAAGTHIHTGSNPDSGFYFFTDAPNGSYDVSLRAIDASGYFASSDPVAFRLNVVPEPASLALLGVGGLALLGRRRR